MKYQGADTIEITKAFQRTVDDYYNKFYRAYINGLTLDKVANFAKQLVLATMIRRNFFDNNQTVGGSIDVLTIASNGKVSWVQKGKNVRDIELKVTSEERTVHNLKKPRISDEPELTFDEWIEKQISLAEKVVNREEKQDDEDSKDEISFKEWINQQIKSAEEIVKRNE